MLLPLRRRRARAALAAALDEIAQAPNPLDHWAALHRAVKLARGTGPTGMAAGWRLGLLAQADAPAEEEILFVHPVCADPMVAAALADYVRSTVTGRATAVLELEAALNRQPAPPEGHPSVLGELAAAYRNVAGTGGRP